MYSEEPALPSEVKEYKDLHCLFNSIIDTEFLHYIITIFEYQHFYSTLLYITNHG